MGEYIKREDALKALQTVRGVLDKCKQKCNASFGKETEVWSEIINACERVINRIPTADATAVVRCKECKWWNTNGCAFRKDCVDGLPCAYDYCSHGEKIEREV